ncbi:MAG: DEAD/DEAH box helicase family protein [Deltaproteobacteria bacterium]|nr:DEAD/DEAH box helicase family protein [Deltaproteobacteria bacterium]
MSAHIIQRLFAAEDLVRRRRADEQRRHISSQRSARIDPNPHQIEAVLFALKRMPDGGCILADEVGLGKTIEAGLVIAQLRAEGMRRILIVTPKALLGQWKDELFRLFGIEAHEVRRDQEEISGDGVFLATRDFVGSERGMQLLHAGDRFELCVIDEAHEVFANIYRRFDHKGATRGDSPHAKMANRVSLLLREAATPVLLLTATPIQNSLLELWGLVHYVDPTGTLLGDLSTFRQIFCPADDRVLADGLEHELQRRVGQVLQRTLRRQAQEFMSAPFMRRQPELFKYTMSPEERTLYEDVTAYLLEPSLYAFSGNQRQLLLIGFHRRMASSLAALSRSLENIAARLVRMRDGNADDDADQTAIAEDLENDEEVASETESSPPVSTDLRLIAAELARVEGFIARTRALPTDSKARAMRAAVEVVAERAKAGHSSGKVVIFTEYIATQDYVRALLIESGVPDADITLFRGVNDSARAKEALARWQAEVGRELSPDNRPSVEVAIRLALVYEFKHRSRILISTEAGAKGLNLQFCDTVINYDLPWNPQRIEQRIGRCHRYAQQRDVTVINFLAEDNEAQRLTYEILSQKLELFGMVLGATDEVLHRPGAASPESLASAIGVEFETRLRKIYDRARTIEEIERELRGLRDSMETRRREFEAAQERTEDVIQRRFDPVVRQAFHKIQSELPRDLAEFDHGVERVVLGFLEAYDVPHTIEPRDGTKILTVGASPHLPSLLTSGTTCLIGNSLAGSALPSLHLGHTLVRAALEDARTSARSRRFTLTIKARSPQTAPLRGRRGRARLYRYTMRGFEVTDRMLPVVVFEAADGPLPAELARALFADTIVERVPALDVAHVSDDILDDALEELLFAETGSTGGDEQERFERTIEQVERFLADRIMLLEMQRTASLERFAKAETARDAAIGAEPRGRAEEALRRAQTELDGLDAEITRLRSGDDDTYRRWRAHTQERRYARPELEQLLEAELEVT